MHTVVSADTGKMVGGSHSRTSKYDEPHLRPLCTRSLGAFDVVLCCYRTIFSDIGNIIASSWCPTRSSQAGEFSYVRRFCDRLYVVVRVSWNIHSTPLIAKCRGSGGIGERKSLRWFLSGRDVSLVHFLRVSRQSCV